MKSMEQLSLDETRFLPKAGKQTRKAVYIAEISTVDPWSRLAKLIEPFYTQKGNQWDFSMEAQIGVNANSGLVHTVKCTTAKVADNVMLKDYLLGEKKNVLDERSYHQNNRIIEHLQDEGNLAILVLSKKPKGGELPEQQKKPNRVLSALRAVVEHPFRVIKQQFGFTKVRYHRLRKNTGQILTLVALSNLRMAPTIGEERPRIGRYGVKPQNSTVNAQKLPAFRILMSARSEKAAFLESP